MREIHSAHEIELKFASTELDDDLIRFLGKMLQPGWRLIRVADEAVIDFYFDSDDLALFRANATFRVRRMKRPFTKRNGYNANTKVRPDRAAQHLDREEIKTQLDTEEVLRFTRGEKIPGAAAAQAYALVGEAGCASFRPVIQISAQRRPYFVVPPGGAPREGYVLILHFETIEVLDVREADHRMLLESGCLDWREPAPPPARTSIGEIEIWTNRATYSITDEALRLYGRFVDLVESRGLLVPQISKYASAVEMLKLVEDAAPAFSFT